MIAVRRLTRHLTAPRFLRWVVAPHIAFFTVAYLTDAPIQIAILNSVDIALSVAVCIAFLPSTIDAIFRDGPADKTVFLMLGIFCGWMGNSLRSGWSLAWRALGMPDWFANTDLPATSCSGSAPARATISWRPARWTSRCRRSGGSRFVPGSGPGCCSPTL